MQEYEIRILNKRLSSSILIEAFHLSDSDAIKTADKLAFGRGVEVWRDLDCIYRAPAEGEPAPARAA